MTKKKKELIDESSTLSSSRWSLITCVTWGIILSVMAIIGYIVCALIDKPLSEGFLGGCGLIIGLIVGLPTAGKTTQSFSEYGNHYFDKFEKEKSTTVNSTPSYTQLNFNDDDGK